MSDSPGQRISALLLFWIFLLALLLRLWGIDFGLPHLYHADEPVIVNHALAYGAGDLNPHFFRVPPLVSYLLFGCYGLFYLMGKAAGIFESIRDFESLFYYDPSAFYLIARTLFGAVLGTLTIYALYALIRRFFDARTALLSAFLLSISFLHVRDSHYIYVDIPLLLCLVLAFSRILRISSLDFPAAKLHFKAGALIGMAAAVKYNGLALVIPYLAASFQTWERWGRRFRGWVIAGAACISVFAVLNPYAILGWRFFLSEIQGESVARAGGTGILHHFQYSLTGALGIPMLLAALASLFGFSSFHAPAFRNSRRTLALFVFTYYAVIVIAGQYYDRYVLPMIPFLCFFAADGILKFASLSSPPFRRIILAASIIAVAAFPFAKSILVNQIFCAKVFNVSNYWTQRG